jgi:hypothetical protein
VPSGFRVEDPTSRKSPPKQSLDGAPSRDGYGITRQVYNARRFWEELQIPCDRAQRRLFLCCAYSHPQKIPAQAKLGRGTLVGFSSLTADPSFRSG